MPEKPLKDSTIRLLYYSYLFIFLFLTKAYSASGQIIREYAFETPDTLFTIPDSLNSEDAVIIFKSQSFEILKSNSPDNPVSTYITKYKRIKALSDSWIKENMFYGFDIFPDQEIVYLDARCIKSDGSIIHIDTSNVSKAAIIHEEYGKHDHISVNIPGIETGDEMEYIISVKADYAGTTADLYFHDNLPVLESSITISLDYAWQLINKNILQGIRTPEPLITVNDTLITYCFLESGLKGSKNNMFSIESAELPHIHFRDKEYGAGYQPRKWRTEKENLYEKLRTIVKNKYSFYRRPGKGLTKKELLNHKCINGIEDKYDKLQALHYEINEHMQLENLSDEEETQPIAYYFRVNKTDIQNIPAIYVALFNLLKIDYDFILAKNIYNGRIDQSNLTTKQFDRYFFRFSNREGSFSFLFPKDYNSAYEINEIPYHYLGTEALLIPNDNEKPVKFIRLDYNENVNHFENRNLIIKINPRRNELSLDVTHSFGGSEFTLQKSNYLPEGENQAPEGRRGIYWLEGINDETINKYTVDSLAAPYLKLNYSASFSENIIQFDSSVYFVPLENIIRHFQLPTNDYERVLVFNRPSNFTRKICAYFVFDDEINFVNENDFSQLYDNNICSYKVSAAQINDTTIYLQSEYKLKSKIVPAKDYDKLRMLNEVYEKSRNLNLIFSLSKNVQTKPE